MVRFGVEEEFMVLDRRTLAPAPRGMAARAALHSEAVRTHQADAPVGGDSEAEFLDCQVEISTTPATTLADAALELRGSVGLWASSPEEPMRSSAARAPPMDLRAPPLSRPKSATA